MDETLAQILTRLFELQLENNALKQRLQAQVPKEVLDGIEERWAATPEETVEVAGPRRNTSRS
jgi:hypothetical protein